MWKELGGGGAVCFLNFAIHAAVTGLIVYTTRHTAKRTFHLGPFLRLAALLTITVTALMLAHVAEITVWAAYYKAMGVTIKGADAFEFAFENYTALGYGDAVATGGWRILGPVTALNGLLLVGWSVAIIFEVMRMAELQIGRDRRGDD
jgi:hypothetical protein